MVLIENEKDLRLAGKTSGILENIQYYTRSFESFLNLECLVFMQASLRK
jgi:hypothetical protein